MVYVPFTKAQHVTNMQIVKKQLMEILPAPAKLTIMVMDSRTEPDVLVVRQMIIYYLNPGVLIQSYMEPSPLTEKSLVFSDKIYIQDCS